MKALFFIVLMFGITASAGSGKLSFQESFTDHDTARPMLGLSVYQGIMRNVSVNSWTGVGNSTLTDDSNYWFTFKNELDIYFKHDWMVAPGLNYQRDLSNDVSHESFYLKAEKTLW